MEILTSTKTIRIVSSRPPKEAIVEITSDDTASAVLEKAGLNPNDYMLMKPGDKADYAPTEMVFDTVPDGGKLHVIQSSTVGA